MQQYLKLSLLLLVALSAFTGFGQQNTRVLNGKVKNAKNDVADILIINLNTKKSTITDALGHFAIEVQLKDSLQFMAVQYHTKKISITDTIFHKNWLVVNLIEKVIQLNEATVMPYNLTGKLATDIEKLPIVPTVTASSIGLPNANIRKISQSERLLFKANSGKYIYYYVIAMSINLHKILNKVSGRTKTIEEMVTRDKNMAFEKEIIAKFSKKTIAADFNIPESNIDGFLTYCLSQDDFIEVAQQDDMEKVWDYLKTKSITFKTTDTPSD